MRLIQRGENLNDVHAIKGVKLEMEHKREERNRLIMNIKLGQKFTSFC